MHEDLKIIHKGKLYDISKARLLAYDPRWYEFSDDWNRGVYRRSIYRTSLGTFFTVDDVAEPGEPNSGPNITHFEITPMTQAEARETYMDCPVQLCEGEIYQLFPGIQVEEA